MDEYAREMMDLKTLVTRTLEKRGVLARIRAELRANVFAAIEEEDRALENDENPTFSLLGSCNERAKKLHASPTGKLLTALICDYLEWCELEHTLKVYLPECNLPRGFWKSELKEKLGQKVDMGASKDGERSPLLVDIVESYLKLEEQNTASSLTGSFTKLAVRRTLPENASLPATSDDPQSDLDKANSTRRSSSASLTGSLPPLGRKGGLSPIGQTSNSTAPMRNFQVTTASNHGVTDESASNEKRIQTTSTDPPIEINGDQNNNNVSSIDAQSNGGLTKRLEDAFNVEEVLSSENTPEGSPIDSKSQHLNSFWRHNTSIALYDDISLESLEEVVEEEGASFEKESCSSA